MRFVDRRRADCCSTGRGRRSSARRAGIASYRFHQPDLEVVLRERTCALPRGERPHPLRSLRARRSQGGRVALRYEDLARGRVRRGPGRIRRRLRWRPLAGASLHRTELEDFGFHERWLVVDVLLKCPKPELGDHTIQYCDPSRPATYVRGHREPAALGDHGAAGGGRASIVTAPARVWELLERWITPAEAELERAAVYTFHSLVAGRWRRDRLLLAGDAAHQTPPSSGRDVRRHPRRGEPRLEARGCRCVGS